MLREFLEVKRVPGELARRWFNSDHEDLIVWYTEQRDIYGFQFCFNKLKGERAITWRPSSGLSYSAIDDGEECGLIYKRTPVLGSARSEDVEEVARVFRSVSSELPNEVKEFVLEKLSGEGVVEP